jgi:hypothetical protein
VRLCTVRCVSRGLTRLALSIRKHSSARNAVRGHGGAVWTPPAAELSFDELEELVQVRAQLRNGALEGGLLAVVREQIACGSSIHALTRPQASHWTKTVFRVVVYDVGFYVSVVTYVLLRWYSRTIATPAFPFTLISAVGSLAAFIVVFYTSQAWGRFQMMYNLCMGLEGRLFDVTLLAQATLPADSAQMLWRHMNAAHALSYMGFSPYYTPRNLLNPINNRWKLLTPAELARVTEIGFAGGSATREVISWALSNVHAQFKAGAITDVEKQPLIEQIMRFREHNGSLFAYTDMVRSRAALTFAES